MVIENTTLYLKFMLDSNILALLSKYGLSVKQYGNNTIGFISGGIEIYLIKYEDVTSPSTLNIGELMNYLTTYLT